MRITYWKDTDTLYIALREDSEVHESEEISPEIVADFTESGQLAGIEVYASASEKLDLSILATEGIPVEARTIPPEDSRRGIRR